MIKMTSAMRALGTSSEEEDLLHRSKKKVRSWEQQAHGSSKDDIGGGGQNLRPTESTYKEKLLNLFGEEVPEKIDFQAFKKFESETASEDKTGTGLVIPLSDEEWQSWSQPWQKTLVVKVLGKSVSFKSLEGFLQQWWIRNGTIRIVDMVDGFFLVYFSSDQDYNYALFEGPWLIQDHYLIVQRWRPFFLQSAEISSRVAFWLRIPKLPLELYNTPFLHRIGSSLGTMLRIDKMTSIHSRGRYARICVEMDLSKPLVPHIEVQGHRLPLEYEGLHQICFDCGRYGHKVGQCSPVAGVMPPRDSANKQPDAQAPGNSTTMAGSSSSLILVDGLASKDTTQPMGEQGKNLGMDPAVEEGPSGYGPWMVPKKPIRKKKPISTQSLDGQKMPPKVKA